MKRSNTYLRSKYMKEVQDTYALIERYIKHEIYNEEELQASWLAINDVVLRISRRHFQKRQGYGAKEWHTFAEGRAVKQYDRHTDRMMMFIQFMTENIDDSTALNIERYKCRFMWLEFLLTCKTYGIALGLEHLPLTKQANTNLVRDTVNMLRIHRDIGFDKSVDEVLIIYAVESVKKHNKFPTLQKLVLLASRYTSYIECRRATNPILASEMPEDIFDKLQTPYTEDITDDDTDEGGEGFILTGIQEKEPRQSKRYRA